MTAIVTGHARGLGAAIAKDLPQRRIPVLGVARRGNDALASPDACAAAFVDHRLGERFGAEPAADPRSIAG